MEEAGDSAPPVEEEEERPAPEPRHRAPPVPLRSSRRFRQRGRRRIRALAANDGAGQRKALLHSPPSRRRNAHAPPTTVAVTYHAVWRAVSSTPWTSRAGRRRKPPRRVAPTPRRLLTPRLMIQIAKNQSQNDECRPVATVGWMVLVTPRTTFAWRSRGRSCGGTRPARGETRTVSNSTAGGALRLADSTARCWCSAYSTAHRRGDGTP